MNRKLTLTLVLTLLIGIFNASADNSFKKSADSLLTVWCDGMIDWQITDSDDDTLQGCLYCEACDKIHGRCLDATYPFMYLYNKTSDKKYLDAAIKVMKWSDNVSAPDGSWTVIPDPNSWKGITVFGAVSLTETLKHFDHLLPADIKKEWVERLRLAGDYIYDNFTLTFTNINYGISAIYALHIMGEYLDEPRYKAKSVEILEGVEACFTKPSSLLYGEGKPYDSLSAKGLHAVDLGYNVEETLNALAQYSVDANNQQVKELAVRALKAHLEFMLPDGGWDNSWGSRQYKWSYWGSRTTEGCFPGYGVLAAEDAAFAEAVVRSFELFESCTDPKYGLISGGIHYHSHGVMPCIHHTFTHAKALASLLDRHDIDFSLFDREAKLPVDEEYGVREFPEVATWLVRRGEWRATVTSYDYLYHHGAQQATGGSIGILYHSAVGPVLSASMACYSLVEANNQQPLVGEEFALTPRVEVISGSRAYSNLFDHSAKVTCKESKKCVSFNIENTLKNSDYESKGFTSRVSYEFRADDTFEYQVKSVKGLAAGEKAELILPIISSSTEKAVQNSAHEIVIYKEDGSVKITSDSPLKVKGSLAERVFNMVPGVEALPISVEIKKGATVEISVLNAK